MANFLQRIFRPEYQWRALDTINRYDISYEHKHWLSIGEKNPTRQYNNSVYKFTAEGPRTRVVVIREYSELCETSKSFNYLPEYQLHVYRKDQNSTCPKVYSEVDTLFASRIYQKMLNKYNRTKKR